jgi:hypothetical protein
MSLPVPARVLRVKRHSYDEANAPRRALLQAVEIHEEPGAATLYVAGEPLLFLKTLDDLLDAMDLTSDDVEVKS